jgi:hypothetical protein
MMSASLEQSETKRDKVVFFFLLVHDAFVRRPNAACEIALGESQPTSQAFEACIVVTRDGRKWRNSWALSAIASVVLPHEGLNSGSRREPDRAAKRRPRREGHLQPTGSRRGPQRPFVHGELTRELIERQAFGVSHMCGRCRLGASEHVRGNQSQSAVPHPKRVQGHVDERGKFLLREIDSTTQFAERSQDGTTMPSTARVVKRPPAYLAGDQSARSRSLA